MGLLGRSSCARDRRGRTDCRSRVYNALASAVRSGYSSFNGWCVRNPFLCAIPGGLGTAALYGALKGIIN